MKNKTFILTIIQLFLAFSLFAQFNTEITTKELKSTIGYLASDSLKGRKSGTKEATMAAHYIQAHFKQAGLKMIKNNGLQNYEIVTGVSLGKENKYFYNTQYGEVGKDFIPLSYSKNAFLCTKIIFVGYGLSINKDSLKWDDYKGVDVSGKWVLVLRGHPELKNNDSKFNEFVDQRGKALTAADKGAAGVIFVTPVEISKDDELIPLKNNEGASAATIPVINITRKLANQLLADANKGTIEELETTINKTKKPNSFLINEKLLVKTDLQIDKQQTQNVFGIIEGNDPILKNEYIVVGAHYDHLGMGGTGSGSRMPDTVAVHHGADDNASGVAGIIELAQKLNAEKDKLKRSVIFVSFSGEELGLLGSKYFVKNLPVPIKQVKAMVNLDMIGRLKTDEPSVVISGTGTSTESEAILNELKKTTTIPLKYSPEGYGASDHASFYGENIPVFFLTTGAHEDYHTPFDLADRINYDGEKQVLDFTYILLSELINRPKALAFKESGSKTNSSYGGDLKVTLGIMPDFAGGDEKGLRADMVKKDGPAFKGGMLKGDVITAIDGKPIKNIYEYMSRLKQLQKGQLISVDVLRNGQKVVLLVQL
jgi:hypothetical protein